MSAEFWLPPRTDAELLQIRRFQSRWSIVSMSTSDKEVLDCVVILQSNGKQKRRLLSYVKYVKLQLASKSMTSGPGPPYDVAEAVCAAAGQLHLLEISCA